MTPKLEEALYRDFPRLYANGLLDGCFRCDDGWEPLIRRLSEKLEGKCVADQVKEKFGGLRFYVSSDKVVDDYTADIDEAERSSLKTCEVCGELGDRELRPQGHWFKTVCGKHKEWWK